jgi:predicted NACHT family NTPase
MRAEWKKVDARVRAGGGATLWLDLNAYGNEVLLIEELFGSEEFVNWRRVGDHRLHIFLDSLDECRLRIDNVAALLVKKLEDCPVERLSLSVGCRTADWPGTLERGLRRLWGEEAFGAYELAPLRRVDVSTAAAANDMQPDAFLHAVDGVEAVPLAIKPVTLEFLLESYGPSGQLLSRQTDLYLDGCRRLCEERNESRVDARRIGNLSANQRLAVAARIAAVTMFSNKGAIWTGLERVNLDENDVLVRELTGRTESVDGNEIAVDEEAVREALGTGLFSARGPERLSWAHQTYGEFLAAHYLIRRGVKTEQAMSLIVHPGDEHGRLTPQLHETAAWLASMSPEVFRKTIDVDPEILLRSDVASTDLEDKAKLVDTMLRLYDEEKLLDVNLVSQSQYRKLEHPSLAEQLRPYIADAAKGFVVRGVALDIAEACSLRSLQGEVADIALDDGQPFPVRWRAARFVVHVGDGPTRSRLKPLATGKAGEDPNDDLKSCGLDAVWPEYMSAEELFELLPWPNENYSGSYAWLRSHKLAEGLTPTDLPVALAWVEGQEGCQDLSYSLRELMDQIMSLAWEHLDAPKVRSAFARAALGRLRHYDEIVQERSFTFATFAVSGGPSFRDRVASDDEKRRGLVEAMLDLINNKDDALNLVYSQTPRALTSYSCFLCSRSSRISGSELLNWCSTASTISS